MCAKLDSKIVECAKKLVEQNRVINAVKYAASKVWFAEVLDGTQLYDVYLDTTGQNNDACSCYEFKQNNYCRHSVAVELYLNVKGHDNIREPQVNETIVPTHRIDRFNTEMHYLLDTFERAKETNFIELTTVQLVCQIDIDMQRTGQSELIYLSLRVGKDKTYTVKQIGQFIADYVLKRHYALGSNSQINWQVDALGQAEHHLIEWLSQLIDQGAKVSGKYIFIPASQSAILFDYAMPVKQVEMCLNGMTMGYQKQLQKLTLTLDEQDDQLVLHLLNQQFFLLEKSQFICIDHMLFPVSIQLLKIYKKILQLFEYNSIKEVTIPQDYMSDFIHYTLPLLLQVAHLNEDFLLKVSQHKPNVSFKLDVFDLSVHIEIEYQYLEKTYVRRDITLEKQITRSLNRLGFKQSERVFVNRYDLYYFLNNDIKLLENFGEVHLPEQLDNLFIEHVEPLAIEINSQGGLLDITFDIAEISQHDIEQILKHIREKSTFYEFSDGRILSLETENFAKVHHILANIRGKYRIKNGAIQLNRIQALTVADTLSQHTIKDEAFKQLVGDLAHPENFYVSVPKGLKTVLKPYQEYGFKWLKMLSYHQLGGVLADDMGLGKTVQAIAYILSEYEQHNMEHKKALVVAPASLIFNWQHEFETFAPCLNISVVSGSKQERVMLLNDSQIDVFMTSYQSFRQDSSMYCQREWHVVVLDESQILKNAATKIHHSLREIKADFMFALSGTPIENRKEDFWSIYSLILPGLFPPLKEYRQLSEQTIAKIARPFLLRRLKKDVLVELPDKIEAIMYSELTKEQKTLYIGYLQRMQEQIKDYSERDMQTHRFDILSGLTRLRQVCCHPDLFIDNYDGSSGKLEQFLALVETAIAGGHRLLVFSQFAKMLTILERELQQRAYKTLKLTGQTPVKERLKMVHEFNAGSHHIFLLSLKVGGTGLNLTSADTIILYDLWWNPAIEEQATSRAHRMGQKNTVQVYRMVAKGTIEEKMMQLQQRKKEIFEEIVANETDTLLKRQSLTSEDLKEILGIS